MGHSFQNKKIIEGFAEITVPDIKVYPGEHIDHARSRAPVFYNPIQKLNRDTAILALTAHQMFLKRPVRVSEPMCGTGVRGIRFALEISKVERVVMGDLNPSAVRLSEENIRNNSVQKKVEVRMMDANLLLGIHGHPFSRFDYIDIDPNGSPVTFLDSAVRAIKNNGIIAVTATDMAPLCGVNQKACLRKYGGTPLKGKYCHEVALRLLAGALVRAAAIHRISSVPIFSYYSDHYVRLYSRLLRGAKRANSALKEMGYILHCPECQHRLHFKGLPKDFICFRCNSNMIAAGPLWLGDLACEEYTNMMLKIAYRSELSRDSRLIGLLKLVKEEIGYPPWFFNIDRLCSGIGSSSLSTADAIKKIGSVGYKVTKTHFDQRGLKTNAPIWELENILKI